MEQTRSSFTKLGFSKSGFVACGRWTVCNLGELDCYYKEIDPEVQRYCACYKRNHSQNFKVKKDKKSEQSTFFDFVDSQEKSNKNKEKLNRSMVHLSLF